MKSIRVDEREIMAKRARDDKPRDDLRGAVSGYENRGPAGSPKKTTRGTKTNQRKFSSKLAQGVTPKV